MRYYEYFADELLCLYKMSCTEKALNQDQVNKCVLHRAEAKPSARELLGPFDLYREENYQIYLAKKKQLFEVAWQYKERNKHTLFDRHPKCETFHCELLNCDRINNDSSMQQPPVQEASHAEEVLVRKRSERRIHDVVEVDVGICCIERWFRRHLILNKFIKAARDVIIKGRLLRCLHKLRNVDAGMVEQLERLHRRFENVSYESLFEKYM